MNLPYFFLGVKVVSPESVLDWALTIEEQVAINTKRAINLRLFLIIYCISGTSQSINIKTISLKMSPGQRVSSLYNVAELETIPFLNGHSCLILDLTR